MTEYIIDGNKFHSEKGFYNYIEKMFTYDLGWKIGRNLNAFNDILSGGFGRHGYGEKVLIKWKNYKKSEERLKPNLLKVVMEILEEHEDVEFYKYDFNS